uniref:class I SAM-dependent methyltransferase n=1 Tax=Flavobacterium sp. TaxID=239 RepID=UPI00404890FF
MKLNCQICGHNNCPIIFASKNENLARYGFLKSPDSPPLATGLDQQVAYCENCNYAWNTVFEYNKIKYDSDQIIEAGHFSKRYIEYQKYSALYLRKLMGFKPDTIVEIGAGAGIFIKEFDAKRKIAIEPSVEAKQIDNSVEVYNEYYSAEKFNFPADIVVLRQVLEHVKDPLEFLKNLKNSFNSGEKFCMYIEVPNALFTFRFGRFYDYYYEHCNHFSIKTINFLADKLNMEIIDLSTAMDGELLSVLLTNEKLNHQSFKGNIDKNRSSIRNELNNKISEGKKILAWGASGNGVQILNNLEVNINSIECVIDSDKNKQGKFIPGTLQRIIAPEDAIALKPDVILVLTQFHKAEIGLACEKLFSHAEVWFVN